jgi:hypothetical protein
VYFRRYYAAHKERILAKNRRWAKEHAGLLAIRRRTQVRVSAAPGSCIDCGGPVVRAVRCRRCHSRFRYATDPEYRARRLRASARWQARLRGGIGAAVAAN